MRYRRNTADVAKFSNLSPFLEGILIEHKGIKVSSDSKLQTYSICSIRIRSRSWDIDEKSSPTAQLEQSKTQWHVTGIKMDIMLSVVSAGTRTVSRLSMKSTKSMESRDPRMSPKLALQSIIDSVDQSLCVTGFRKSTLSRFLARILMEHIETNDSL